MRTGPGHGAGRRPLAPAVRELNARLKRLFARATLRGPGAVLAVVMAIGCSADARDAGARPDGVPTILLERAMQPRRADAEFGRITAVVADDSGNAYVADAMTREVVVLDRDGRRTRVIGGAGSGPGELAGLDGLALHGELLLVLEMRRRQVKLLEPGGGLVASAAWPGAMGGSLLFTGIGAAYGRGVVHAAFGAAGGSARAPRPAPRVEYAAFSRDASASPLPALKDSLVWPPSVDCESSDGSIHILALPFTSDWGPLRAFLDSGRIAMAHRDSFRIDLVDVGSGALLRSIRRDHTPAQLGDEDWERLRTIRELREVERTHGRLVLASSRSEPCPLDAMRPELFPVIRAVFSDDSGRLWVESRSAQGFVLSLFDADGTLLGETAMPDRDGRVAPFVRGDLLYIVTVDELDVQTVVAHRLRVQ